MQKSLVVQLPGCIAKAVDDLLMIATLSRPSASASGSFQVSYAWQFLLAFVVVAVVLLAIGRSRRRHTDRSGTGQFCGAKCANPTHGILKSSNHAQLRSVRTAVLRAVRGDTSRRKKICVKCIAKLCRKPEYRHLFKAKVRTATIN